MGARRGAQCQDCAERTGRRSLANHRRAKEQKAQQERRPTKLAADSEQERGPHLADCLYLKAGDLRKGPEHKAADSERSHYPQGHSCPAQEAQTLGVAGVEANQRDSHRPVRGQPQCTRDGQQRAGISPAGVVDKGEPEEEMAQRQQRARRDAGKPKETALPCLAHGRSRRRTAEACARTARGPTIRPRYRCVWRSLGSRLSRSQSPKRFSDSTERKIATPGKKLTHQAMTT